MQEKTPPLHIIFVGAFVFKDGKILLGKRSMNEGHLPGYWAVPGGKVETTDGDQWNIIQKTAVDEVKEETGVTIADDGIIFSNVSFIRTDGRHVVAINVICTYISGEPEPLDGTSEVMWATKDDLESLKIEANTKKQMLMAFDKQEG